MHYLKVEELKSFNEVNTFDKPYVVRGGCSDMPAVKKWDVDYLGKIFKGEKFLVEIYNNLNHMELTLPDDRVSYLFDDFKHLITKKTPPYYYIGENNLEKNIKKDHVVFNDIYHNTNSCLDDNYSWSLLFLGNSCKTSSHFHLANDFVLNQVFNKKVIYLYDYGKKYFKERKIMDLLGNFTKENFFKGDHSNKDIYKVILNPGDSIYIPPWWWHATETDGISCSITKVYHRSDITYLLKRPKIIIMLLLYFYKTKNQ